jgi:hypothetical protein
MIPKVIIIHLISLISLHSIAQYFMPPRGTLQHIKLNDHVDPVKQSEEAVRLWEQAVAAKGGRERLHAVHNLVVSSRGKYLSRSLKKNQVRGETLFVLPNKYWDWDDYRPDVFGLRISMYDYDSNTKYVISDGDPNHTLEPITDKDKQRRNLLLSLLPYLTETKWLKPVITRVSSGRVGLQPVDIVQTTVEGKRVDFALDRKSHLPVRISYYSVDKNMTYLSTIDLSNYVDIGGIKMPQTVKSEDGTTYKQDYKLNVEYNENIFVKPPPIEAGPEAWKVAKR